jgi:hypothetical protein
MGEMKEKEFAQAELLLHLPFSPFDLLPLCYTPCHSLCLVIIDGGCHV